MTEAAFFDKIGEHYSRQLPFVIYSRPINRVIKTWLQSDDSVNFTSDFLESGFVFAPFDLQKSTVLFPQHLCDHYQIEIDKLSLEDNGKRDSFQPEETNKSGHISAVENGIKAIKSNVFSKVVLSRFVEVKFEDNPILIFKRLFNSYENAMVYCWFHPKVGLWIGATPELLFKVENNQLTTISLAGTKPYVKDEKPQWTTKEIEEQRIVTDYLSDQIRPFVSDTKLSEVESIRAGKLWHLKSRIISIINNSSNLNSIIEALHPTPAVCGQPKDVAKAFILNNENYDREFYTGFLGELNLKQQKSRNTNRRNVENNAYASVKTISNFYVNLRCAQIKDNKARIYVGGGIVKDSNPEKEWQETQNKSKTIGDILA